MKVLIIQQKMIGDVLTSSILFEILKKYRPEYELHYLVNSNTKPVIEHNPYIDNIILYTPEIEKNKFEFWQFLKSIKKAKYDIVIDVYSKTSSNLITLASGAKKTISYYKWYTQLVYKLPIKRHLTSTDEGLAITNRLQLLEPILDTIPKSIKPKIYLTEEEINLGKAFLLKSDINLKKPIYMISVLGSGKSKTYPFPYMAKIIDTIVKETDGQILFNYIPKQKKQAETIYNLCTKKTQDKIFINTYGKSLRDFFSITHYCKAVIGNEGGAINMAKALGVPTFSIFSPWIDKGSWNLFEDNNNTSVHLKDYNSELFIKSEKKMKKVAEVLYLKFSPELFITKLKKFLA